jgi:hypothetical protein
MHCSTTEIVFRDKIIVRKDSLRHFPKTESDTVKKEKELSCRLVVAIIILIIQLVILGMIMQIILSSTL